MHSKLLENRNKMLKAQGINETLFMALITLDAQESRSIQPSELSAALGSSRTNATRIADELEKKGWIERRKATMTAVAYICISLRLGLSFYVNFSLHSINACIFFGRP